MNCGECKVWIRIIMVVKLGGGARVLEGERKEVRRDGEKCF